jgi:hypothetical protein
MGGPVPMVLGTGLKREQAWAEKMVDEVMLRMFGRGVVTLHPPLSARLPS